MNTYDIDQRHLAQQVARGLGWFSIALGAAEIVAPRKVAELIGSREHDALLRGYGAREIAAGLGILSGRDTAFWMGARVAGDVLDLTSLAMAREEFGADRSRLDAAAMAVAGVTLLDLAVAGYLSAAQPREVATPTG